MERFTKISIYMSILYILMCNYPLPAVDAESTIDETISYLETAVPASCGIETYFKVKILGREINGVRQENYKLKILNRELILIQKNSVKHTETLQDTTTLATAPTKITEVIRLENLNPKISLIYKTEFTEGSDVDKSIYPPHIKIKITANSRNKWKAYQDDMKQVISMLNQADNEAPASYFETDSYKLITTDETAAERIANALSYLILRCSGQKIRE